METIIFLHAISSYFIICVHIYGYIMIFYWIPKKKKHILNSAHMHEYYSL